FLSIAGKKMGDIDRLAVTGVGAAFLGRDVLGIEVVSVDEFRAIGLGGLRLSGEKKALVVSVGTGTAFVRAEGRDIRHVGGSGVGGGTIIGLCSRLAGISDFDAIVEATAGGRLENVDLALGDISKVAVGNLPADATASNFGKVSERASGEDLAAGVVNMVFQTVGMIAVMAARAEGVSSAVMVGKSTRLPMARAVLAWISSLYDLRFVVPELAEYATAIGAALALH
ncbi:MAG TPA: pantothenate kinase, partial [Rectinemataceae bacterium]|nr:pantothenate kinase [Rectinemataceae bacterium]